MKRTIATVILIGMTVSGCGRNAEESAKEIVTVGTKNFTEQLILGELMAQLIEADSDLEVKRVFNLGGTMICHEGLVRGELDIYAEYTGTALTAILKKDVVGDPEKAYELVSAAYEKQFDCKWLSTFGFNNTYAITVRTKMAEDKKWKTISDLKAEAENMTAGFTAEFMEREDGYPGLRKAYGLQFGDTRDMEPSLMYQAIAQENVDVICAFATDGRIAAYDLKMLEDDKGFFPPYYAGPVVRRETLAKHPFLRGTLEKLAGAIDDATMRRLNNEVDQKKRDPADVARDVLVQYELVPSE